MCTGYWWEKPEGERPLKRPRHRWEDNIKMDVMDMKREKCGLDKFG
jgi:hypothetical protein